AQLLSGELDAAAAIVQPRGKTGGQSASLGMDMAARTTEAAVLAAVGHTGQAIKVLRSSLLQGNETGVHLALCGYSLGQPRHTGTAPSGRREPPSAAYARESLSASRPVSTLLTALHQSAASAIHLLTVPIAALHTGRSLTAQQQKALLERAIRHSSLAVLLLHSAALGAMAEEFDLSEAERIESIVALGRAVDSVLANPLTHKMPQTLTAPSQGTYLSLSLLAMSLSQCRGRTGDAKALLTSLLAFCPEDSDRLAVALARCERDPLK
ncbi:hypothetical protein KIPB_008872, partial [Kipferlia bialata]